MNKSVLALGVVLVMILAACGESKFKIEGLVEGAEGKSLVLEKSDFNGRWIPIDSTSIGRGGKFSISGQPPVSPDIYRLSLGDKFVYFPIDSVENLTLTTTLSDFGRKYSLKGSRQAEQMASFEQELMSQQSVDKASMDNFKRNVFTKYIKDGQGSILSYYVLTKYFNGRPLYDPEDIEDAKYYAAVATQFENFRPDDPHGRMVKEVSIKAMRNKNDAAGKKTVLQADELKVIDIDLQDPTGKNVRLSDVVGKGKPVVVVFSMMNEKQSPEFNLELNKIYKARNGAVQIYQVSFDNDQYAWREAARNLPWINVIDPGANTSTALRDYNVQSLPAVFLYDANGDLIDRPATLKALESKL